MLAGYRVLRPIGRGLLLGFDPGDERLVVLEPAPGRRSVDRPEAGRAGTRPRRPRRRPARLRRRRRRRDPGAREAAARRPRRRARPPRRIGRGERRSPSSPRSPAPSPGCTPSVSHTAGWMPAASGSVTTGRRCSPVSVPPACSPPGLRRWCSRPSPRSPPTAGPSDGSRRRVLGAVTGPRARAARALAGELGGIDPAELAATLATRVFEIATATPVRWDAQEESAEPAGGGARTGPRSGSPWLSRRSRHRAGGPWSPSSWNGRRSSW